MPVTRICKQCGKEFVLKHANMKYCSPECGEAAHKGQMDTWYLEKKDRDARMALERVDDSRVRKDCFGYDKEKRKCTALRQTYCGFEDCKFYKRSSNKDKPLKGSLKKCEWCGKYFEVTHHGSSVIYCSPECRRKGRMLKTRLNNRVVY